MAQSWADLMLTIVISAVSLIVLQRGVVLVFNFLEALEPLFLLFDTLAFLFSLF